MITGPATVQNVVSLIELPLMTPEPCKVNSRPSTATTTPTRTSPGLRIVVISLLSRRVEGSAPSLPMRTTERIAWFTQSCQDRTSSTGGRWNAENTCGSWNTALCEIPPAVTVNTCSVCSR